MLTLFAWPSAPLEPRDLPVGVAGPPAATAALEQRLAAADGAFDVHRYGDEAAAREAIEDRDVYGAFVATPDGAKVLTASAASPMVAQLLTHAASEGAARRCTVEDVVSAVAAPASRCRPPCCRSCSRASSPASLAVALGGGALRRAGLVVAGSVLAGLVATAIIAELARRRRGDWAVNAAGAEPHGGGDRRGRGRAARRCSARAGVALTALTMILIGNPFSGVASGARAAAAAGRRARPAAAARARAANLLRSTGFFDGAAATGHVAVLAAWTLLGFAALAVAALRSRRTVTAPAPAPA